MMLVLLVTLGVACVVLAAIVLVLFLAVADVLDP